MVHSNECVTVVTIKDMESYNGVSFFTCLLHVLNWTKMVDVKQCDNYYINYLSDSKTGGNLKELRFKHTNFLPDLMDIKTSFWSSV